MALAMDILWAWQSPQKKSGSRGRHWGSGVGTKHPSACGIGRAGLQFPSGLLYTSGLGFTSGLLFPWAVVAGNHQPLPPPHSSGSNQSQDVGRLWAA